MFHLSIDIIIIIIIRTFQLDPVCCMIKLHSNNTAFRGLHYGKKCDKQCNQLCPLDKADVLQEACDIYCLGRRQRTSKRRILMKVF